MDAKATSGRAVDTVLPDAAPTNWVDRHAPGPWRPWLKLARLDRPTGIPLLMIPGWQGVALADARAGRWPDPVLLLAFAVGAVLMRAAGCAVNDIADKDFDARVSRTAGRPVASGRISRRAAGMFALACTGASVAILLALNVTSFWLALASLPLVIAYPFMKRITWWPQAWLGLTFNWGVLLGYAAACGGESLAARIGLWPGATVPSGLSWRDGWLPAQLLYAAGVAWTLGYDTIYAIQDLEDDALVGVKSSARRLGKLTPWFVLGAYAACVLLIEASGWTAGLGPLFATAAFAVSLQFVWQLRGLESADPTRALAAFKSNTWAGLIVFAALALGHFHVNHGFTAPR
jgi:4-hydroxybenzoate polyprenyltransferase